MLEQQHEGLKVGQRELLLVPWQVCNKWMDLGLCVGQQYAAACAAAVLDRWHIKVHMQTLIVHKTLEEQAGFR
jgi:hypothetical protein